jgi:hypothetical protein
MMAEPKPLASLSSGLLARKGQAAPAMRRQGMMGLINAHDGETGETPPLENIEDDLGWNDMGDSQDYLPGKAGLSPMAASPVVQPQLQQRAPMPQVEPIHVDVTPVQTEAPAVVQQQQALAQEMAAQEMVMAIPVKAVPVKAIASPAPSVPTRAAPGSRGKAAFTLRLDPERHLKLRLACAVSHKSAQNVVTAALDAFLATQNLPEIKG